MARTRVKICGIRDEDAAAWAVESGADAIGLVFVPGSPRRVRSEDARTLMYTQPPMITVVGVVANLSVDAFVELEQECPCQVWQLHGNEDDATVRACGPGVIKAIGFDPETIDAEVERWSAMPEVSGLLVDNAKAGSGEPIDWAALRAALDRVEAIGQELPPVFLAGGLTPDTVGEAIRTVRPWGVDVSSGVESERGVKDRDLIRAFCDAVQSADAS